MSYRLEVVKRSSGARPYGWNIYLGSILLTRSRMTYNAAIEAEAAGKEALAELEREGKDAS